MSDYHQTMRRIAISEHVKRKFDDDGEYASRYSPEDRAKSRDALQALIDQQRANLEHMRNPSLSRAIDHAQRAAGEHVEERMSPEQIPDDASLEDLF